MIRPGLILKVIEKHRHPTPSDVEVIIKSIFGKMAEVLAYGDCVEIWGGCESASCPVDRYSRERGKLQVSPKGRSYFKPGKNLREGVSVFKKIKGREQTWK